MIPFVGNALEARAYYHEGHYGRAAIYGALTVSDVFLVKSLAVSAIRGIAKVGAREATERAIVKEALEESSVNLYRAVSSAELDDIVRSGGAFRNPLGVENKFFSTAPEGAASYARQTFGTGLYQGPYTIVGTQIQSNLIDSSMRATVDRGISTVVVPTRNLPALSPAQRFNFTPLPPRLPR